jgi:hypothetical protein
MRSSRPSAFLPLALAAVLAVLGIVLITHAPRPQPTTPATGAGPSPTAAPTRPVAPTHASKLRTSPPRLGPSSPRPDAAAPRTPIPTPKRTSATTAPAIPVPGDGPGGDRAVQQLLDRSSPADLPAAQERDLVRLASLAWKADVTGRGRERWPAYFGSRSTAAPHGAYRGVRIQAGIARAASGQRAEVHLVWAGTDPSGAERDGRTARLFLKLDSPSNRWEPVR